MQMYQHWRIETDADAILWLYFDKQGSSANTLDGEVMEELSAVLDGLAHDKEHKGVVIASLKKNGFIAGADISQFKRFKNIDDAVAMLILGQQIFTKLEKLTLPTVAMIDGFCLGGGLELALACRYRVAEDGAKTRLGLPEVKLGIQPGWGGSVRLPRLIGGKEALNLILSGHTISGKAAAKLGLVDVAVPKRQLVHAAKYYVLQHPPKHQPRWWQSLTNQQPLRGLLAQFIRKQLSKKANPLHYPAPFAALDNWEHTGVDGDAAYTKEAKTCGRLFFSDTASHLIRVFYLQERLKSLAKDSQFSPQYVHVVGAGTMGGDIAAWCALQGMRVTLQDREPRLIAPAIKRAYTLFKDKLKEPYLIQRAMDNLMPDVQGYGVSRADVIIEAIFEDLPAKQALFKELEQQAKPTAILATNTSSIPLDEINTALKSPERLVGIHFFNPVAKMLLVEIVKGNRTHEKVIEQATTFVRKIDRLPLPVKSSPGFLINRILMPYLLESVVLLGEGIPAETIDKAMIAFGMPMGPIELADTVGLDVCLSVATYLGQYLNIPVPERLTQLVKAGKLGRKTSEGFYQYKKGKKMPAAPVSYSGSLEAISDRLVLRMLDEAFSCLREGVVADGDLLDAGMIFATGFAPFHGGPMHYAKVKGIGELYRQYIKQCQARGEKLAAKPWEESVAVS